MTLHPEQLLLEEPSLTALADGTALVGFVLRVHTLSLRTGGHRAQNLSTGLTPALLTRRNLKDRDQVGPSTQKS